MCRVVLMNKQGEREIERIYGLDKYFTYLEKQLGGHGNGFALLKNNRLIKFEKGVKLDVRDIARTIKNTDYDWCLFHTRLASVGDKSNRNCHPFIRKNTILAMNGTESSVSFLSNAREITDTEAILETISKFNLSLSVLKRFKSIFMGFHNGKPFVVADNISSIKILHKNSNNAIVFASSFPYKFRNNIYVPQEKFMWSGGKMPANLIKFKSEYYSPILIDDYIYHDDLYSQCYIEAISKGGKYNGLQY